MKQSRIAYDLKAVDGFLERSPGFEATGMYEAGLFGFALVRPLHGRESMRYKLVAASLMPKAPGNRLKTGRRDARDSMELGWLERTPAHVRGCGGQDLHRSISG